MNTSLHAHLTFLYGPEQAAAVAPRLEALLARFQQESPGEAASQKRDLTQHDTLLITYADQVNQPGKPPLRTLAAFAARHLREVVSGIHLLPFYPWSSDDGFSVKDYFAVEPAYGTWADLGRFRPEFDLMFDAVFNHLSAQSEWFQRFLRDDPAFRDFFIMVTGDPDLSQVIRPRALPLLTEFPTAAGPRKVWTTFSADQVDLNFQNPEVLLATLAALLLYVRNGARFIRLDAIAFLWKEIGTSCLHRPQTHRLVQLMRTVLDRVAPGVRLITETNVPHTDNLSYFGDGTNEAHLVYNFALPPLVLHAMQTGNAVPLTRWAQTLALPSPQVTFFNFLASHDGVGLNPARGILSDAEVDALVARTLAHGGLISYKNMPDGSRLPYEMNINYLDALSNPAANEPTELAARKFLTAQAVLLSLQGVPGIYFHSLFGSRGDRAGAAASGIARRINREKLNRDRLETELAEPASLRTQVFRGYRERLKFRRAHAAFAPASPQHVLSLDPRIFAILRETPDGNDRVLCLHNVSGETVDCPLPPLSRGADSAISRSGPAGWLAENAPSSAEQTAARPVYPAGSRLPLPPWTTHWLVQTPAG
ncbi:MAG: sugar phosphorylase [Verrucomicrobia bacterium]|nr:sugar phosphorylase [Verrucomicrobiota bacterium]